MTRLILQAICALAAFGLGGIALAATEADYTQCRSGDQPETIISACNNILASEDATTDARANAHYRRGWGYFDTQDYDRALADFEATVAINARDYDAIASVGAVHLARNANERAIEAYTRAIAIRPTAFAYNNRGVAYQRLRDYPRSIADFSAELTLEPDNANALNNRAWSYYRQGNYADALVDLNRALAIRPHSIDLNNRGLVQFALGVDDAAIVDFTRSIELKPDYAEVGSIAAAPTNAPVKSRARSPISPPLSSVTEITPTPTSNAPFSLPIVTTTPGHSPTSTPRSGSIPIRPSRCSIAAFPAGRRATILARSRTTRVSSRANPETPTSSTIVATRTAQTMTPIWR